MILAFKNIINENQHGFVTGRSFVTNPFIYTNFVAKDLDNGFDVHSVYTDFSKAFDLLDQNVLIKKLENYGIRGYFLSWFSSSQQDRVLQVTVNGILSNQFEVVSGVPQGSHSHINMLMEWCAAKNLKLNTAKCTYMFFSRSRSITEYQYVMGNELMHKTIIVKDFGVYFDESNTWRNNENVSKFYESHI